MPDIHPHKTCLHRRCVMSLAVLTALGLALQPQLALAKLVLGDDAWRQRLTPEQYRILRQEGTERPFTSPLNGEKRDGVYQCAGCQTPLFTSEMKFDSGTGWPSFFDSLPGVLGARTNKSYFMVRTEYHCATCGGHHGHIFDDGPPPTGKRYCNNGAALVFIHNK